MTTKIWTKEEILSGIQTNNKWVERGVVAIYNKQTEDEKMTESTNKKNGIGYSGCDAHLMSYYAKWILSGKSLSGKHLEKARKKISKYANQLTKIANKEI